MSMRWIRSLVVVVTGMAMIAGTAGVAQADPGLTVVVAGNAEAGARGTTAGIALLDRATGVYADNGANARLRFGSASLVKLFIADSMLRRAALGQITLSKADRDSMAVMLRSSDDPIASRFWGRFGGSGMVNDVVSRYHLTETKPPANPRYWGLTQISAHDIAMYYRGLLDGTGGLSPSDRDFIVACLRQATSHGTDGVYQWFGLHDGLPHEPAVGVKQGWMSGLDGHIYRHSAGIVGADARYIVVVLGRDPSGAGSAHTVASVNGVVRKMFPAGLIPRVRGGIGDSWYATGGPRGGLGLPITGELRATGGAWQAFQNGRIYWSPSTGAHWLWGSILKAWEAQRSENGHLGYPTSDERYARGGSWTAFQGGRIYWSPATGAQWIRGGVLDAWAGQGSERGPLGFPITKELPATGGAWHAFQNGRIYWSPSTGAHWMTGPILKSWMARGSEHGPLGYPTSDPRQRSDGTRVDFQRGSLTLKADGQVVEVRSASAMSRAAATTDDTTAPAPSTAPTTSAPSTGAPSRAGTSTSAPSTSAPSSSAPSSTTAPPTAAPTPTGTDGDGTP
jgi:hypothetical protein